MMKLINAIIAIFLALVLGLFLGWKNANWQWKTALDQASKDRRERSEARLKSMGIPSRRYI